MDLVSIFVSVRACVHPQPYFGHVWTDFIHTRHKNDTEWYAYARHFFRHQIQDGRLSAMLVVKCSHSDAKKVFISPNRTLLGRFKVHGFINGNW